MLKTKPKLIPPDLERCQATWLGGSFMTLGPRPTIRCPQAPIWIAKERKPGKDGQCGSMALCDDCVKVLVDKLGKKFATFTRIKPKDKVVEKLG